MKKLIVFLFCLSSHFLFAHTINYDKIILRHWSVVSENKFVDGSFYMYKNGYVFIEDANANIIHFPLTSLSKTDQEFALNKAEWVKELNDQMAGSAIKPIASDTAFEYILLLAAFLLVVFGLIIVKLNERKKLSYLIPALSVVVLITLFSFKGKVLYLMSSTTDPLSVDSAFTPFKPNIYTHWDSTYFYVESIGIPTTHPMMTGITNWQQQVPIPQCYIGSNPWSIPLNPVIAATPVPVSPAHFTRGAVAVAVNGIPIFNPYTNTGADAFLTGQLDNWGGHCGRADDYHYHIAPISLYNVIPPTSPVAFALDGFAVYGNVEPDGSPMAPLDTNNGHFGANGVYHYHAVPAAPYMIGYMVGEVTEDTTHQIIPQAHANPIRPAGTPLNGAVITGCQPNSSNNGYTLTYTLSGNTDSIVYSWNASGQYVFHFYTAAGNSTSTYNGFIPCTVPTSISENGSPTNEVMIYPNPSHDGFTLQLNDAIQQKEVKQISIYNMKGDLIYRTENFQPNATIKNLAKGIYVLKVQFADYQLAKKLVVH